MRNIAVVGSGQAGLLLGIGLLDAGYRVTLVSDRAPDDILHGPIPAGAIVFDDALQVERDLKLNLWDDRALPCQAIHVDAIGPDGKIALSVESRLDKPGRCVDLRLKSYRWMEELALRGGQIVVKPATLDDLERYAREHDLVVIATGKSELSKLFPKDEERSSFQKPPRHVSMVVVTGLKGWSNFHLPGSKFSILPGAGEIFSAPLYAKDEIQANFIGFEAIPGGPMDRISAGMSPQAQLDASKRLFHEFLPWDHAAVRDTALVDERACLAGSILPVVRKPVGVLPSGAHVMGIADTVILQDPISAQGANNAAKMARLVKERIVERGDRPFDPVWMTEVFEEFWRYSRYGHLLHAWLLSPPQPHALDVLVAASQFPAAAARFVNGFNHPPSLFPWLTEPEEARRYVQSLSGRASQAQGSTVHA